jgi:hypothetical protein
VAGRATLAVGIASHCLAMLSQLGDGVMQMSMTVAPGFETAGELYGDDNNRAMLQRPAAGDYGAGRCMLEAAPSCTATFRRPRFYSPAYDLRPAFDLPSPCNAPTSASL